MSYQRARALLSLRLLFLNLMPFAGISWLTDGPDFHTRLHSFDVFIDVGRRPSRISPGMTFCCIRQAQHCFMSDHAAFDICTLWRGRFSGEARSDPLKESAKRHGLESGRRSERPSEERSHRRGMRRSLESAVAAERRSKARELAVPSRKRKHRPSAGLIATARKEVRLHCTT